MPTVHVRAFSVFGTVDVWRVPHDMRGGYGEIFRMRFAIAIPSSTATASSTRRRSALTSPASRNSASTVRGRRRHVLGGGPAARAARDHDLRGRVHEPAPAGLRGVRIAAAQPGAPGEEPEHAGPAQPRPARDRRRDRRQGHGRSPPSAWPGPVRRAVHRGPRADEGAVDRASRHLRRGVLAAKDAAMEPKPVQKPHPPIWFGGSGPCRAAAGGPARRRLLRRRIHDDRQRSPTRSRSCARRWPRRAGTAGEFRIAKRVYIAVD